MVCFVCKCLSSDTPQGFTGQVTNVRSGAWEFPSTKAVLPLFVTPQRTSGSITRDPYLALSPVRLCVSSHSRKIMLLVFLKVERFQMWVVCVHLKVCVRARVCV